MGITKNKVHVLPFLLLFWVGWPLHAQFYEDVLFSRLTIEQGLSQGDVFCTLQDSRGLMWFGTQNGLNRYDGRNFVIYRQDPTDPYSIPDDWVLSLAEDHNKRLWIGSQDQGLSYLDLKTGLATPVSFIDEKNVEVRSLLVDRHDRLWIGTINGLYRASLTGADGFEHVESFKANLLDEHTLPDQVQCMIETIAGEIWVGTSQGLFVFNEEEGRFKSFDGMKTNGESIRAMFQDHRGRIWLGWEGKGLVCLDQNGEHLRTFEANPDTPDSLVSNSVRSISQDQQGIIWIGTENGLSRFDRDRERFSNFRYSDANTRGICSNLVRTIYVDKSGVVWFGTDAGLSKYSHRGQRFSIYRTNPERPNSMSHNHVQSIWVDDDESVWLGTLGGGLNKLDRKTQTYQHYRHDADDPTSLGSDRVRALFRDKEDNLWIGTDNGLNRMTFSNKFKRYPRETGGTQYSTIMQDRSGAFWLGTWGQGLQRVGWSAFEDTLTIRNFYADSEDPQSLSHDNITCLLEDQNGSLWIGTLGGGLDVLDANRSNWVSVVFRHYKATPGQANGLSSNRIRALHQDRFGNLWIGTLGGGLNKLDRETNKFTHYAKELSSNAVLGILEDGRSFLWLATQNGLVRFDPNSAETKVFGTTDGLQSREFGRAYFKSNDEEFFFGGKYGANSFFPREMKDNEYIPPLLFTSFKVNNTERRLATDITEIDTIEITHREVAISFDFAALDYTMPEKNRYSYRMVGLSDEWIDRGTENQLSFFRLPYRELVLEVRGSNSDGVVNTNGAFVKLIVKPPIWWTLWAKVIYSLIGMLCFLYFLHYQKRKLDQQTYFNQKLKEANEQLTMADRIKDDFLANTSHELRTPLNGMIGIADSMLDGATGDLSELQRSNLSMIVTSGMRLANLVNDILDISKLKRSNIQLDRKPVDVYALSELVIGLCRPLIGSKDLKLQNQISPNSPAVFADVSRLEQVLHNLVGNALKFTEAGTVTLSAHTDGNRLALLVSDTGIGIPEDRLERIFESFEQADGSISRNFGGTGLGLAISKQLVDLHEGEMTVTSELGVGTTFRVALPMASNASAATNVGALSDRSKDYEAIIRLSEDFSDHLTNRVLPDPEFHILMVDDEPINLQVLKNYLAACNYTLTQVSDGMEAMILIRDNPDTYDMVLLDVMMPKISGFEVCKQIRQVYPSHKLPVIMLTAKNRDGDVVTGFEAGASDYLLKPVSKNELLVRIRTHLDLLKTSRKLEDSKEKLLEYNRNLEQKVAERTLEIEHRNKELLALDELVMTINREVELDQVLNAMVHEVDLLFEQTDKSSFIIANGDGRFRFGALGGYDLDRTGVIFTEEELVQELQLETVKEGNYCINHQHHSGEFFLKILPKPCVSLVLPIHMNDKLEGLLVLDHLSDANAFDLSDQKKLARLQAHAVSAIAKAQILEEVRAKHEELMLAQTQLILQEKMVYLGNLTKGIAHEIQNPINFIFNFSSVGIELITELSELLEKLTINETMVDELKDILLDLTDNAKIINEHSSRVYRIVKTMMMHSHQGIRDIQATDVHHLLDDQYDLAYHGQLEGGVKPSFEREYDPELTTIEVVPQDLCRVFLNVLVNAFEAMERKQRGQADYQPELILKTVCHEDNAKIIVRDNGDGINEDNLAKVFTPFFSTKPTGNGVGLGLSISFDMVTGHGGVLSITSKEGEYTQVEISLPKCRIKKNS